MMLYCASWFERVVTHRDNVKIDFCTSSKNYIGVLTDRDNVEIDFCTSSKNYIVCQINLYWLDSANASTVQVNCGSSKYFSLKSSSLFVQWPSKKSPFVKNRSFYYRRVSRILTYLQSFIFCLRMKPISIFDCFSENITFFFLKLFANVFYD